MRFAGDQFCGAVQQRGFPSLPFTRAGDVEGKEKEDDEEEEEKTREREGRRMEKRETSSLVAESPRYEGAIERRNVVVVPGSVCTDGGRRCGEVRWYNRRRGRPGERERRPERGRQRKKETER